MGVVEVMRSSVLMGDRMSVWERITSVEGINHELMPVMRMRFPPRVGARSIADLRPGQRVGRVWLLYLGFLPLDFDDLTLTEVSPGSHFQERSRMLAMRRWEHRRTVRQAGPDQVEVIDLLRFEPRPAFLAAPAAAFVRALFAHRHRRLRAYFA